MHSIFTLLTLGALAGGIFFYQDTIIETYEQVIYFSFCEEPIPFHVGTIDPKFNTDKETVVKESIKAADIWNDYYQTDLFSYEEDSVLELNLVFDERQRQSNQINSQEQKIEIKKVELGKEVDAYKEKFEIIESALSKLNEQIEFWNVKGGAPTKIYEELIGKQNELNEQITTLNKISNNLNYASSEVNSKIDLLNSSIGSFNKLLDTLPEEGIYMPAENKIEIYFYDSAERFEHTVAHELGHALGLKHVLTENSLLNPTTSDNLTLTDEDIEELLSFCREQNKFEFLKNNFELIINNIKKDLIIR